MSRLTRWLRSRRAGPVGGKPVDPPYIGSGDGAVEMSWAAIDRFVVAERRTDPVFDRFMMMVERDVIVDDQGTEVPVAGTGLDGQSAGMLYYLTRKVKPRNTIETGFGLGTSALTIMLAKRGIADQKHIAIDPYGVVPREAGASVSRLIERTYGASFERVWKPSEIVLPALLGEAGGSRCDLAFVDGDHRFDGVLIDFYYLDRLSGVGSLLVFDDIQFPAVETTLNFIAANKPNYKYLDMGRLGVLEKLAMDDQRMWSHFRTFDVPRRPDFTPRSEEPRYAPE